MSRNKKVSFTAPLVSLAMAFAGDVLAQQAQEHTKNAETQQAAPSTGTHENSDMKLDAETLRKFAMEDEAISKSYAARQISQQAQSSAHQSVEQGAIMSYEFQQALPEQVDLTEYMPYLESRGYERNQGQCSNCYAWAGTGAMEIALATQLRTSFSDRLSVQFYNSCWCEDLAVQGDPRCIACTPQTITNIADFYKKKNFVIPWENYRAYFRDNDKKGNDLSSFVCGDIGQAPRTPIQSVDVEPIDTIGPSDDEAIVKIKNVLTRSQPSGVLFSIRFTSHEDYAAFETWWRSSEDTELFDPDGYCNNPSPKGGDPSGHMMLIVGYDTTSANPGDHYWLVLNSFGTPTNHPRGTFRMKMQMNYSKCPDVGPGVKSRLFQTLNVKFEEEALHQIFQMPPSQSLRSK